MSDYPFDVPSDAPGYNFFRPIPWSREFQERCESMSFPTISMDYDKAFARYEQQFITWLYDNFLICNGDMLVELMENPYHFENFMAEQHPEIGELV